MSREDDESELTTLSAPIWLDLVAINEEVGEDKDLQAVINDLWCGSASRPHFCLVRGRLFFRGRLVLLANPIWVPKLIPEYHSTAIGGHFGAYRIYHHLAFD